ncbi:MAG: Gfo/Idh/MocA family oxidoreductase [Chlamydiota bacterium]|nr:Gfo/Idh/MocA family oxidoreductase [Chlamydiota bacterium]
MSYIENTYGPPPSVLLVGHGIFGAVHRKALEDLEKDGRVIISGVVDIDQCKLEGLSQRVFKNLNTALKKENIDIVAVVTNTGDHANTIESVLEHKSNMDFFIEKSFVENVDQAKCLANRLSQSAVGFGFLIRQSPAIKAAIEYINKHQLKVEKVGVVWKKKRQPTRPSAGVHIDEACHSIDALLHYILPSIGACEFDSTVSIKPIKTKYSNKIIDKVAQEKIYGKSFSKPMAEVSYNIEVNGIQIKGLSSFIKGPVERKITIDTMDKTRVEILFDKEVEGLKGDHIRVNKGTEQLISRSFSNINRVKSEWEEFLNYRQQKNRSFLVAGLYEAIRDLKITKALAMDEVSILQGSGS